MPPVAVALAVAAFFAVPASGQASGADAGTPEEKAAPAKTAPKLRTMIVHRQAGVEIPSIVVADKDKTLPAGTYDISLVASGAEGGKSSYRFEFFSPESKSPVAQVSNVDVTASTAAHARELLGARGRRRARSYESDSDGESDKAGASRRGQPLVVVRQGSTIRLVYREETSHGTVRLYQASMKSTRPTAPKTPEAPAPPETGQG